MPQVPALIYETPFNRAYDAPLPALTMEDVRRACNYAKQDRAESSRKAYESDFRIFSRWRADRNISALPATPETVAAFLAAEAEAGRKPSTIGRRCAAIKYCHKLAGYDVPPTNSEVVKATVRGIRRVVGTAPRQMAPALAEITRDMARAAPAGIKGLRDRALILMGFAGAFRRSELTALNVEDVEFSDDGLRVTIRRSKTDTEGKGQVIAIVRGDACCPVKALRSWLDAAGIVSGPIFRSVRKGGKVKNSRLRAQAVCVLVKQYADRVGLDGSIFGAHSLRAGFLSSAARRGASIWKMKQVSRHKSTDVLSNYIRDSNLFENHAGAGLL